jgi:predicted exporter
MNQRLLALLWGGVVLLLAVGLSIQFYQGISLKTDITELLPGTDQAPEIGVLSRIFRGNLGRTVIVRIEGASPEARDSARRVVERHFKASDVVQQMTTLGGRERARAMFDFYFPYRYQFLARDFREGLRGDEPVRWMIDRVRRRLRGMTFSLDANLIEKDPLLLYPGLINQWISQLPGRADLTGGNGSRTIIARLSGNPFRIRIHETMNELMNTIRAQLRSEDQSGSVSWTGVAKFSHRSRTRMLREMSVISTVSTLGILLLILLSFRNIRYLLQLLLSIGTGLLTALTISLWWFPDLHLVTVTFGASLIGVCVDYSFHYFVEADTGGKTPLWTVFPGILLGLLTTVIAYAFLSLTPFPALRQMALFSSLGLIGAFLPVVCWYPLIPTPEGGRRKRSYLRSLSRWILGTWKWIGNRRLFIGVFILITGVIILAGALNVTFTDDIRQLGNLSQETLEMDRALRAETGFVDTGRYLLVRGDSPEQVLNRGAALDEKIGELQDRGILEQYYGVNLFVPSRQRQQRDRDLLRTTLTNNRSEITTKLDGLGYGEPAVRGMFEAVNRPIQQFITIDSWLDSSVSAGFRSAWLGRLEEGYGSVVVLRNIHREAPIKRLAGRREGIFYHNRLSTLRTLLGEYRREALGLILISYLVISVVLLYRYGLLGGLTAFLPSATGGLLTVAVLTYLGYSLHIMHVVALLLILGMGVDYGIFLTEGRVSGRELTTIFTAILLSAFSTILSFGLLALSDNPILHAIGATVSVGMISMLLYAPMPVLWSDQ